MKAKWLGLTCALILFAGGTAVIVGLVRNVDYLHSIVMDADESITSIHAAEELKNSIQEHNRLNFLWAATENPTYIDRIRESERRIDHWWNIARKFATKDDEDRAIVKQAETSIRTYVAEWRRLMDSNLPPLEVFQKISDPLHRVIAVVDRISDLMQVQAQQNQREAADLDVMAHNVGYLSAGFLILLLCGIVEITRRTMLKPLTELQKSTQKFGRGDWNSRASIIGLKEMRDVGAVFNEMADGLSRQRDQHVRFLASLAHDLRNPLTGIKMSADILRMDGGNQEPDKRQMLDIIGRQALRLDRMVSDLLDMARIEAKQLELHRENHDLVELISDSIGIFKATTATHSFINDLPASPTLCTCDGVRISQVLNNLISNAVKYSPFGGQVKISLKTADGFAEISVSDQGTGIAAEELDRIFEPFRRSAATKDTIPGVGLGLASTKAIVEAHEGRIVVESKIGTGSTFRIFLPLARGLHAQTQ